MEPHPFTNEHGSILHALEIDPTDANRWYAGVEGESERISGVYLTTDGGQTWSRISEIAGKIIWSIAVWQKDPNIVVAGAADGIYKSSDRGKTWARISPEANKALQPVVSLALDPLDPQVIYAGTTHLPWRTTNGGQTWQSVHSGMLDDSDVFSIVVHPERRGVIYASACSGAYRSGNSASLWSRLATPRGTFRTYVVAVDPNTPTVVYAGTSSGLLRSADEGKTWKKISGHVVKSIDFDQMGGRIYFASTTGGILISSDRANTIVESNSGFVNRTWVALSGVGGVLYATSVYDVTGGLFRSSDAGATWSRLSGADATRGESLLFLAPSPQSAMTLLGATRSTVFRSNDGGKTWVALTNTPASGQIVALSFTADAGGGLYLAASSGLYKSRDEGKSWHRLSLPFSAPLRSLQFSGSALFAIAGSAAAVSRDSGETWTACGAAPASVDWYGVALKDGVALKAGSATVLAATSHGLLRSTDSCQSWAFVRKGVEASTVMTVGAHPSRPEMFAVQRGRLLHSGDEGETWQSLSRSNGSETTPIVLAIFPDNPDSVFALFRRTGVALWKLEGPSQAGANLSTPTQ